jgi:hypothetical protein
VDWIHLAQDRNHIGSCEYGNDPSGKIKDGEFFWRAKAMKDITGALSVLVEGVRIGLCYRRLYLRQWWVYSNAEEETSNSETFGVMEAKNRSQDGGRVNGYFDYSDYV